MVGDKRITIRTSVLEEKATACNMLCCYADELKGGFHAWVQPVAQLMVPLLTFGFHEDVRKSAAQSLPQLLASAKLAAEAGCPGKDLAYLRGLVAFTLPPLVEALPKEQDLDVLGAAMEAVGEIATVLGPELAPQMVDPALLQRAFACFAEVMDASEARREERRERAKGEDFDEEEREALEEEDEEDEAVVDGLFDCLNALARAFRAGLLPYLDPLLPKVLLMLGPGRTSADRRMALCVLDDVVEFGLVGAGQAEVAARAGAILPRLLESAGDAHAEPRQAAVYGLGAAAQHCGPAFGAWVGPTLGVLQRVISAPGSREGDAAPATDNAISAVGKILEFQRAALTGGPGQAEQVARAFLGCLPIRADLAEAHLVHEQLVRMVEAADPAVLGPNQQNAPEVLRVLAQVGATMLSKEPLMKPELAERVSAIMRHFGLVVPKG